MNITSYLSSTFFCENFYVQIQKTLELLNRIQTMLKNGEALCQCIPNKVVEKRSAAHCHEIVVQHS